MNSGPCQLDSHSGSSAQTTDQGPFHGQLPMEYHWTTTGSLYMTSVPATLSRPSSTVICCGASTPRSLLQHLPFFPFGPILDEMAMPQNRPRPYTRPQQRCAISKKDIKPNNLLSPRQIIHGYFFSTTAANHFDSDSTTVTALQPPS